MSCGVLQWFLTDVIRRTIEAARFIFDYCLSPSCRTTSSKRARSLSRIVESTAFCGLACYRLRKRLGQLNLSLAALRATRWPEIWVEIVDSSLRRIFEAPLDILPLGRTS